MAANFFNISKHLIKYRLNSGKSFLLPLVFAEPGLAGKEVYFKRSITP
jgi:hypothetical protein